MKFAASHIRARHTLGAWFVLVLFLYLPTMAHAQRTLTTFVQTLIDLVEYTIPIVMSLALIVFFFGGARFIWGGENEQTRAESKVFLFWGVVGLFVMVSIWGIVLLIESTFF
jgi:hypothetical protein